MTGCAPTGFASLGAMDVAPAATVLEAVGREPAALRSIISTPETPPPIT